MLNKLSWANNLAYFVVKKKERLITRKLLANVIEYTAISYDGSN